MKNDDLPHEAADRYLNLMKRCLTRLIFADEEVSDVNDLSGHDWTREESDLILAAVERMGLRVVRSGGDTLRREEGQHWRPPSRGETLIGLRRLENVQTCVIDVIKEKVPGDLIEAGVWRGGTTIFMRAILAAVGDKSRRVWVADSFQGFSFPSHVRFPADAGLMDLLARIPQLSVTVDEVKANFARYDLLDDQVQFLPGWFRDTLPSAPIDKLAVIRLDADLYESTMDALTALYPKLSLGGYLLLDDYHTIRQCQRAVTDFRTSQGIEEEIKTVDWNAAYWKRLR